MADSGILWIDTIFDWAVIALVQCAKLMGITYEEINVWLFVIGWPLVTLIMMVMIYKLWRSNHSLTQQLSTTLCAQ
jgi:hypothetical protein